MKRLSLGKKRLFAVLLAILVLLAWGFLGSKYALELSNYVLSSPKLTAPIRVVQLTDLHNSEFGENNGRLVRMIQKQSPDVILLTGDMLNGDEPRTEVAVGLIEQLAEIAPVYASFGNHEKANENVYGTDVGALYAQAGAHVLERTYEDVEIGGQTVRIGGIYGYCLPEKYLRTREAREKEVEYLHDFQETDLLTLLLCHVPTSWIVNDNLEEWDVDVIFSGHVHGGQVRLPLIGGLYAPDQGLFPGRECGLFYSADHARVMVLSRGLGSGVGVPRFGNVPEIVVVDIVPQRAMEEE
ncbi:MAG: metallophosphoesterase [Clostridia bacterium]|nr:metallophosphoesterase [Clostridia bacterium]